MKILTPVLKIQFCSVQNHFIRLDNSEIWLLPSLQNRCKQVLLSASAKALKICMFYPDPGLSFNLLLCIWTSERILTHAFACVGMVENNKRRSKIIKNILFSSCVQGAHVRLK